jgi:uncharacterized delta-60 repeat protein
VDTTFAATQPVAVSGEGKQIIALADGRALLVGPATIFYFSPSFITRNSVIMLTTNGLIDTSFANAPLAASAVLCVAARPGGKYLVGGAFTTTGGSVRTNLVQLDNTGAQDNSFVQAPVSDLGFVRTLHPMSDGRIVINGAGAGTNYIRRVNNDGTVDGSFTSASSDAAILTAAVQPDGKIWIAGDFLWINDVQRLKVARLNLDGSLDLSYNSGDGTGTSVFALTLQPDGKLLMGGAFGCYNNICIGHIIRLLGDFTASSPRLVGSTFSVFVQTTTGKNYTLQYKNLLSDLNWTSLPSVPGDGTEKLLSDPNAIGTQRIYRVVEN